jgi:phosphatidylserine/phosphatidylglycerophosphate/cardiolipin synthase-like enzyme
MKTVRKSKVFSISGLALILLAGIVYLVLVTPKRFIQCLSAPVRTFHDIHSAQTASLPQPVAGNRVQLLTNGSEALPAMLTLIAEAQESIRWQVMLFFPDEAGYKLAAALADASRRGVKVQLSFNMDQTVNGTIADNFSRAKKERLNRAMQVMLSELRQAGVEVRPTPPGLILL